jgi:hypothetical protein
MSETIMIKNEDSELVFLTTPLLECNYMQPVCSGKPSVVLRVGVGNKWWLYARNWNIRVQNKRIEIWQ